MKIPRDLDYQEIIKVLASFGYTVTRQTGSHIRLTTEQNGEHHKQYLHTGQLKLVL